MRAWLGCFQVNYLLYFVPVLLDYTEDIWEFLLSKIYQSTRKGRVGRVKKERETWVGRRLEWVRAQMAKIRQDSTDP